MGELEGRNKMEAKDIFDQLLNQTTQISIDFDHLNPPLVRRLWRKKGDRKIDENKDWKGSYDEIKHFNFILKEYTKCMRTIGASADRSDLYKNLYVFENHESANNFLDKRTYISRKKASEIFIDPDNRYFSAYNLKFVLNKDGDDIIEFSKYLSSLAHDMRIVDQDGAELKGSISDIYRLSRIYCLGPQGIGKTTTINYLFSTQSPFFYKKNTLWFRIDFNQRRLRKKSLN
ncbi:MAG: hypothetical protein ACFFDN_46360, partial [Candidatus Hodarchaeota archaeon]